MNLYSVPAFTFTNPFFAEIRGVHSGATATTVAVASGFLFLSPRRVSLFLFSSRRGSDQFSTTMNISA
jgi:hypothetical protein